MSTIAKLPAKTLQVLELIFEGKDSEEIQNELNMKPLVFNNIVKRLVKDDYVDDNDGVLEPTDEVVEFFETTTDAEPEEETEEVEEVEEKPAKKSKKQPEKKAEKKPAKKASKEVDMDAVLEEVNKLMDMETPLESEADLKVLVVENTDQFEKEDVKELSEDTVSVLEALAKKGKVLLPWQEKPKRKAPKKVEKGPGIVASIVEFLEADKLSKKELLEKLCERFPDREAKGMRTTVNCQVPKRLTNDKGLKVMHKDDKYWIKK